MKDIYVVTKTEWSIRDECWDTSVVYCFERRDKADDFVKAVQDNHSTYDVVFKIEIVEVIE